MMRLRIKNHNKISAAKISALSSAKIDKYAGEDISPSHQGRLMD